MTLECYDVYKRKNVVNQQLDAMVSLVSDQAAHKQDINLNIKFTFKSNSKKEKKIWMAY